MLGEKHQIGFIRADHRFVSGDHHHFETVDLLELECLGVRGARHSGQFCVQAEIILEGDGRDGLVFLANLDPLLGLDRLVQAVGPASPLHGAAGELIDDDDFALAHDVFDVALVQGMRAQRRVQVMHEADIGRVIQALALAQQPDLRHQLFDLLMAVFGERRLLGLFVHRVIARAVFGFCRTRRGIRALILIELGALFRRRK